MDIDNILKLCKWIPLSEVVGVPKPDHFLGKSLYLLEHGIYLYVTPFIGGTLEKDPAGPFLTGVVWATDDGAAERAIYRDIEADSGSTVSIPKDFLPQDSGSTYADILKSIKRQNPKVCQEKASYRIATDGAFVHRIIETEEFSFFFRSLRYEDNEEPYAVIRNLKG